MFSSFGWPAAVAYATLLNVLCLRDLARNAIKARVEGFVDKRAFLPLVCGRSWIPERAVARPADLHRDADALPITDGNWRAVLEILKTEVDRNMALGGWDRLADLDRSVLFASRR